MMRNAPRGVPAFIELSRLDWEDRTFEIESFAGCDRLHASLDLHGPLTLPWVWERSNLVIVDGFKRLRWARDRGLERMECRLFPPQTDAKLLMALRMEGRAFGAPPNAAEKAQMVAKLASVSVARDVMDRVLAALHLSTRTEAIDQWRRLAGAGGDLLQALACDSLCERAALELIEWEDRARWAVIDLLSRLRCSASIQMEILERVSEIACRQECGKLEILRSPELGNILGDPHSNHRQKTQAIRDLLTRWRLPRLQARVERFAGELALASLPKSLCLAPPPYFEGEQWQLRISFTTPEDLERSLRQAETLAGSSLLRKMMSGEDGKVS